MFRVLTEVDSGSARSVKFAKPGSHHLDRTRTPYRGDAVSGRKAMHGVSSYKISRYTGVQVYESGAHSSGVEWSRAYETTMCREKVIKKMRSLETKHGAAPCGSCQKYQLAAGAVFRALRHGFLLRIRLQCRRMST